ncbi:MAG TPA: precorrin-3B C(17)-methyltransferase, partial [Thermodesulfovibrionales bacterium]|nr:precorrin-3B C(17)-methyltransferase [Thermodesulfovibrionales bacterium]
MTGTSRTDTGNSTIIFYITAKGLNLARRLKEHWSDARVVKYTAGVVPELWKESRSFIFIMATGIVARTIAPLIEDKKTDPAVVVVDEAGRFAISLLSGHLGGANALTREIASLLGGEAVITTASDLNNLPSLDLWAKENGLVIEDWTLLPRVATKLLNRGTLRICCEEDAGIEMPREFTEVSTAGQADLLITHRAAIPSSQKGALVMRPKNLVVGIGCNRGTASKEIEDTVRDVLARHNLSFSSVSSLATIDIKMNEPGLMAFAEKSSLKIQGFTPDELNTVPGITVSKAARKATGANAVAEPAALLASGNDVLLVPKQRSGNVTVAVAKRHSAPGNKQSAIGRQRSAVDSETQHSTLDTQHGRLYIVGTGPGNIEHITPYAQEAIRKSEVIVGYGTYLRLIPELLGGKEVHSTGMTKETERCRKAVELALSGRTVAVISGGDPGIYAMAGLVFELLRTHDTGGSPLPEVEVVPGISALNACAARLGAPLMHDFACISLSDRLTPWELIVRRLDAAAMADFVIVLYNPKSMGRPDHIRVARDIVLKHRTHDTAVGIVKGAMREEEQVTLTTLEKMLDCDIDMQTTVIIGN